MSSHAPKITVAYGDGIGPEIMTATLKVLEAAQARLDIEVIEIGESVYRRGHSSGIEPSAWDSLRRTGVFLKAPITTPQGGGFKSLNVTIRKSLGLYANIRPCVSYHPFVATKHPTMDVVIVRENEEDLYAGIEHRQTDDVVQCLKLITRTGCEKIVRYAFEYARQHNRRKVTCFTKDNIMKMTDGLFHRVFEEVAAGYPEIQNEHLIVDIGAARLADTPEMFDVIVTPNLYGDILSDVAAQIAGSIGMAGSANIGEHGAMFEAIHGSAPMIAGRNQANPSGLLLSSVMMLAHLGQHAAAEHIHNAWLRTLEDGVHTSDIYKTNTSSKLVGTQEMAHDVIARLGEQPRILAPVKYNSTTPRLHRKATRRATERAKKETVGIDVFLHWDGKEAQELASSLQHINGDGLQLSMITNRGVKVWPNGIPETFCTDHWRCRFTMPDGVQQLTPKQRIALLGRMADAGFDFVKTENLCMFDGVPGYSLGQGQ